MGLLDHALQLKQDLGLFFYVATFLKQAKGIAWSRLKQCIEPKLSELELIKAQLKRVQEAGVRPV
jgi:hypothetical protein